MVQPHVNVAYQRRIEFTPSAFAGMVSDPLVFVGDPNNDVNALVFATAEHGPHEKIRPPGYLVGALEPKT